MWWIAAVIVCVALLMLSVAGGFTAPPPKDLLVLHPDGMAFLHRGKLLLRLQRTPAGLTANGTLLPPHSMTTTTWEITPAGSGNR